MKFPGLVDLQVNGFGGIDFNSPMLRTDEVEEACRLLYAEGVVAFLPTLVTNDFEVIESLARTILAADDSLGATILGLHLEGPFISPHPEARGAHTATWICAPDINRIRRMQNIFQNKIKLLTFSPEWHGSAKFIEEVCGLGIRVAIGHTMATPEEITQAADAGATLSTHLGNGIPTLLPRHPNPIWSQLAEDRLWVSLIGDGFHLSRDIFQTIIKVKRKKAFLVSDSTKFAGMKPGKYQSLIGGDVVLTAEGKLSMAENENLMAGSAMSLRMMIESLTRNGWLNFKEAWKLGSIRPWRYLGERGCPESVDVFVPKASARRPEGENIVLR
ncbi:MAG: hypothetical protein LBC02_10940 [Planctomycetaceae bacterium]|jgi:N-acetylglucosamine-6-phosphate deacetylase|nr:hypothetical protein [Planctomycetaceae bacterium]